MVLRAIHVIMQAKHGHAKLQTGRALADQLTASQICVHIDMAPSGRGGRAAVGHVSVAFQH